MDSGCVRHRSTGRCDTGCLPGRLREVRFRRGGEIVGSKVDPEHAANAGCAFDTDLAAHQLDQALGDDQSDAGALRSARLLPQSVEGLKERIKLCRLQTRAGVLHGDANPLRAAPAAFDVDRASFAVVLDGVGQEIEQHLLQPRAIGDHHEITHARNDT